MNEFSSAVIDQELDCAEQLARFFPRTLPVRIPVQVSVARSSTTALREATVLQLGDADHAIFVSALPLEFNDRVRLEREPDKLAEATVVAVQYHAGRKAVAVKFDPHPCDWITQS